jgi:hypothetical protein
LAERLGSRFPSNSPVKTTNNRQERIEKLPKQREKRTEQVQASSSKGQKQPQKVRIDTGSLPDYAAVFVNFAVSQKE